MNYFQSIEQLTVETTWKLCYQYTKGNTFLRWQNPRAEILKLPTSESPVKTQMLGPIPKDRFNRSGAGLGACISNKFSGHASVAAPQARLQQLMSSGV